MDGMWEDWWYRGGQFFNSGIVVLCEFFDCYFNAGTVYFILGHPWKFQEDMQDLGINRGARV